MPILVGSPTAASGYSIGGGTADADGQIEWGGALLGAGTVLELDTLDGWTSLPDVADASVPRPAAFGAMPGRLLAGARTVTATFTFNVDLEDHRALAAALQGITQVSDDEAPLVVNLGGLRLQSLARVLRRTITADHDFSVGGGKAVVQWVASDPRRYDTIEQVLSCGLPQRGTGWTFPLAFPLDFGDAAASSGSLTATVGGSTPTPPRLVITGPCADPVVVNQTTGQALKLAVGLTLTDSDVLSVDTLTGQVLLNGRANRTGSVSDDSVLVEDFVLSPGQNVIAFRADVMDSTTAAARLSVVWRDAVL